MNKTSHWEGPDPGIQDAIIESHEFFETQYPAYTVKPYILEQYQSFFGSGLVNKNSILEEKEAQDLILELGERATIAIIWEADCTDIIRQVIQG